MVFLLHNDGGIFQYTGTPFAWEQIDNNPATVAIAAAPLTSGTADSLYQLHNDGGIWGNQLGTGPQTVPPVPSVWQQFDGNPANSAIAAGGALYQLHNDGSIFQYTGTPFGWQQIDGNPANAAIAAGTMGSGGSTLYLLHNDGSGIFQYIGTPFAWQQIDNNPATVAIAAGIGGEL